MAAVHIAGNGARQYRAARARQAFKQPRQQQLVDILRQGAADRGDKQQDQRKRQRAQTAGFIAERPKNQLTRAQPQQAGCQAELGGRRRRLQVGGQRRQRRQVKIDAERPQRRQ